MDAVEEKSVDKISENAFNRLVLTAVLGILACIVCLCSTTFAWYTASVSGGGNEIQAAGECLLEIAISGGENPQIIDGSVTLQRGVVYTVTLSLPKGSPSGYCLISTHNGVYRTDSLARHGNDTPSTLRFTLSLADDAPHSMTVSLKPHWGIYSGEVQVTDGGSMEIE